MVCLEGRWWCGEDWGWSDRWVGGEKDEMLQKRVES